MGTNTEELAVEGGARATTLSTMAIMGLIALVAVTLVVVWARASREPTASAADAAAVEEPIPESLVGGIAPARVPDDVAEQFHLPVVGAAELDELPPDVADRCGDTFGELVWDERQPQLVSATATPDSLYVVLEGTGTGGGGMDVGEGGEEPDRFRVTCTARMHDGAWVSEPNGFQPVFGDEGGFAEEMGGGFSCCDENGLATATGAVEVPDGAVWGLQERSGWYLAYPVAGRRVVNVTWKFREQRFGPGAPPPTTVTFVDDDGEIIAEAFTGGMNF